MVFFFAEVLNVRRRSSPASQANEPATGRSSDNSGLWPPQTSASLGAPGHNLCYRDASRLLILPLAPASLDRSAQPHSAHFATLPLADGGESWEFLRRTFWEVKTDRTPLSKYVECSKERKPRRACEAWPIWVRKVEMPKHLRLDGLERAIEFGWGA
jgi:hypothetical protein